MRNGNSKDTSFSVQLGSTYSGVKALSLINFSMEDLLRNFYNKYSCFDIEVENTGIIQIECKDHITID